jgi:hypothetical protein
MQPRLFLDMDFRKLRHALLAMVLLALAGCQRGAQIAGADVEHSGEGFLLGDLVVVIDYGYSNGGDRLRYLVIRAYPASSTPDERMADSRYDINSGALPRLRHPDGAMRLVQTDGRAYLFIGDELRTMCVAMNEHTDTIGLARADSLEAMWTYLQQFRVGE